MLLARVRRFAETHHKAWCVAGMLLMRHALEDEPMQRALFLVERS